MIVPYNTKYGTPASVAKHFFHGAAPTSLLTEENDYAIQNAYKRRNKIQTKKTHPS
jgi:hypothetical protein